MFDLLFWAACGIIWLVAVDRFFLWLTNLFEDKR